MSLELINTVAALTTAAVIAATAVAALAQLRHLRAGNQIAGFLTLRTMLDDAAHQQALVLVRRASNSRVDDYRAHVRAIRAGQPMREEPIQQLHSAVQMLGNAFEVMGTLVRNGIVDRRLFLEQYCSSIIGTWGLLEPYIVVNRQESQDDGLWEDFEYLAVLSNEFIVRHPSVYPKGIARLLPSYASPTKAEVGFDRDDA